MAGASMNDIKTRIKSVKSTMQITKAMELVATSKLRRAKERMENTRPYYDVLSNVVSTLAASGLLEDTPFDKPREVKRTLYVVIAGDRGLAGGYNSQVFKLAEALAGEGDIFLPIGKKAHEYLKHRGKNIWLDSFVYSGAFGVSSGLEAGKLITRAYALGEFDCVKIVYTRFVSMLTQSAVYEQALPLEYKKSAPENTEFDDGTRESVEKIIGEFIGGILYSCMCESVASEHGARRSAMSNANRNAGEMIDTLMLKYNRARQAVITQEITEIVSGAEAQ